MKSLSGKTLPLDWPQLINNDEAGRIARTLPLNEREFAITYFSYELSYGKKALLYLATTHSNDPKHPQFPIIEQKFNDFDPALVLYEGPFNLLHEPNRDDAIKSYGGESGFIRWIVKSHNQNLKETEKEIEITSGDQPWEMRINDFQKAGFSNEEIGTQIIAAHLYYANSVSKEEIEAQKKFNDAMGSYLREELQLLPRADGKKWTLELAQDQYKKMTGKDLNLQNNYPADLREMFDANAKIRDVYIIKNIVEKLKSFDRVLVIMGSAHPIRQKKALEEYFS